MKPFVPNGRLSPLRECRRQLSTHLLAIILAVVPVFGIASDQECDAARQSLVNDWEQKFTRLETAQANFQQLFLMSVELVPQSRDLVLELVNRHRDFSDANNRKAISDALCSDKLKENRRGWYLQHALARQKEYFLAGRDRYRSLMNSFDVSSTHGQVDIYDRGASNLHVFTIGDLRKVTTKAFVENAKWEHVSDSRFQLSYRSEPLQKSFEAEIDATTGFVHTWRELSLDGNVLDETLQYEPMVFGDGIVYPRMRVRCEYNNGNVTLFDATFLENAAFNQPIPDEEFRVPVEKGSTVVDRRGGVQKSYTAKEQYADAVVALSLLESARVATTPARPEKLQQQQFSSAFLLFNILAISAIAYIVMRKRKSAK